MALRVLVTRPQPQADAWVERLRAAGLDAQALPLIDVAAPNDARQVQDAWAALPRDAMALFVSPNAVAHFFAVRPAAEGWPSQVLAACTGPGTGAALRANGVPPTQVIEPPADAPQFDSEALWHACLAPRDWRGHSVLIVRGDGGRNWLADTLKAQGAAVRFVQAYARALPVLDAVASRLLAEALARPREHLWLFSSSQAIEHLSRLAPAATDWSQARALATHPRIAASAHAQGMREVHEALPTEAGVIAAISTIAAHIESTRP